MTGRTTGRTTGSSSSGVLASGLSRAIDDDSDYDDDDGPFGASMSGFSSGAATSGRFSTEGGGDASTDGEL